MTNIKALFAFVTLFVTSIFSYAQDNFSLTSHIPQNALGVVRFNGETIQSESKVDFEKIQNTQFYLRELQLNMFGLRYLLMDDETDSIPLVLGDFESKGIKTKADSYFYFQNTETYVAVTYIFELSDMAKFKSFVSELTPQDNNALYQVNDNVAGFHVGESNLSITWSDQMGKISHYYAKDDEVGSYYGATEIAVEEAAEEATEYMEEEAEEQSKEYFDSLYAAVQAEQINKENAAREDFIKDSYNIGVNGSILQNDNFAQFLKLKGDITMWLNHGDTRQLLYHTRYPYYYGYMFRSMMELIDELNELYDDSYLMANIDITDEGMDLELSSYMKPEVMKYNKKFHRSSFRSSMFKYVSNDYMFCAGYSFNPKPLMPAIRDLFYPVIQKIPEYGQTITDMIDVIDIFVDQKAIYKLVEGDAIFVFNGFQTVDVERTYRQYNENYDYEMKSEVITRTVPKLTFLFSTNNEEGWEKIFGLGISGSNYHKRDNYYEYNSYGGNFYYAFQNGVALISTDKDLIVSYLKTGLPANQRLSNKEKKKFKKNNMVVLGKPSLQNIDGNDRDMRDLIEFFDKTKLNSLEITGGKIKKKAYKSYMTVKFGDQKESSVNFLYELLNELYEENRKYRYHGYEEGAAAEEAVPAEEYYETEEATEEIMIEEAEETEEEVKEADEVLEEDKQREEMEKAIEELEKAAEEAAEESDE